jgi:hypothetical protein
MRTCLRWSAWLCLSLMLWTVAAESTHVHPSQTDANSCSVCVAAHTANPAPSSAATAPIFNTLGVLQDEAVVANASLDSFVSGNRGPPEV